MLEKWKQRAIQMNLKRAVIIFVVVSFILMLGGSAALYGRFKGRANQWESAVKTDRESETEEKGDEQKEWNDFENRSYEKEHSEAKPEIEFEKLYEGQYLSAVDIALIAGCGIIGVGLAVWYWLLCMIWAYRKSHRMGVNSALWVLATLFFNLATIAVLYLYAILKGTCDICGRIRTADGKYCDRCGKLLNKKCPDCGQIVDAKAEYCRNCGKKLNE